jgi:tripartite-type tricarboxylate transporter receptor subunit TctC
MRKLLALCAATVALSFAAPSVLAQDYPNKPIKIVLPSASGGLGDVVVRLLGQELTKRMGQNVILENKPGAGGVIGMQSVIQSPADGYTLVMGYIGVGAVNQFMYNPPPYDTLRDFVPVGLVSTFPSVVLVKGDLPVKNMQELIAHAKANPGKLTYASAGPATSPHLITELFKRRVGIDLVHVPYKGAGPAMIDFLAGRTDVFIDSLSNAKRHESTGKYRILGITTGKRSPLAPEIPTIAEQGVNGFEAVGWFGLFAPAATPAPVVDKLSRELAAILKTPEMQKQFHDRGMDPAPTTAAEFRTFMREELDKWGRVVREAGIKAE